MAFGSDDLVDALIGSAEACTSTSTVKAQYNLIIGDLCQRDEQRQLHDACADLDDQLLGADDHFHREVRQQHCHDHGLGGASSRNRPF
ncbi:MAG: hypothetical protein ABI700_07820 [Chloroflexota bacterium]